MTGSGPAPRARLTDGARLAAVRAMGGPDPEAGSDPEFDRYTALAADLLGVPISLITLVERDRQRFLSAHGLDPEWARVGSAPLSHSLCHHALDADPALLIDDVRADPRVWDTLAARDLGFVAYAGVPLRVGGHAVGALCAVDRAPRAWRAAEVRILRDLGAAVATLLELRRTPARDRLHDGLTGLPGAALTAAHADRLAGRTPVHAIAVALDGLGAVNDRHGPAQGDRLIAAVARRLGAQITAEDILGRVRGDTFLALVPGADTEASGRLALALREALQSAPVTIRGELLAIRATVGPAVSAPGADGETLIDLALRALAPARGEVATPPADPDGAERANLRGALSGAVRRGEVSVDFQPIVELRTGRIRVFEALARWRHPTLGAVEPTRFIPEAEASGDIVAIGEHVLRRACEQLARWRRMLPGDPIGVTVNVSPVQLELANLPGVVAGVLAECGLPGDALTVEITEGLFVAPAPTQLRNLAALRELGVRVALDDFGTGYSALHYLKRFPVDLIKVDRCFLSGLEREGRDAALMRAILAIGEGMELDVIAEGVETPAQRAMLAESGCRWGQGFLFAGPLPAELVDLPPQVASALDARRPPARARAAA